MIAVQFIFTPITLDDEYQEFHRSISAFVEKLPGHIGVERWVSKDGTRRNSIYYFTDRDSLAELAGFTDHLAAKSQSEKWYQSHQVVVSEVLATYGNESPPHISTGAELAK